MKEQAEILINNNAKIPYGTALRKYSSRQVHANKQNGAQ